MTVYSATKIALRKMAAELEIKLDLDKVVFQGGKDPGGWSSITSLVCIIHEGTGLPNEYNYLDPFGWWIRLGEEVSELSGKKVFFEAVNSCVSVGYKA